MKAKYIFIIILLSVIVGYNSFLSQGNNPVTTDLSTDSNRSKNLIDRFNTFRALDGLQSNDIVLDMDGGNVAKAPVVMERQAELCQNVPNPFTQSTQIQYYLPETVGEAFLCIYDKKGQQLKQIVLTERGFGSETVFASEFALADSYFYGLIIDGNRVDLKRMRLIEDIRPVNTDLSTDSKRSKNLIDRFNTLRALEGLQSIEHDTVLDNISKILLTDETKIYRKSAGVYDEDSIRLQFREKGILDYRYEIKEILDRDTVAVFKYFFLADSWSHIRAGYYRTGNRHILLKTESYLKYTHVLVSGHCESTDKSIRSVKQESKCYTDSLRYYFKILIPDQYYYRFDEKIPSSSEKEENIKKEEIQMASGISEYGEYDFSIKSVGHEIDKFLVILNKNNQRVVVIQQK